MSTFRIVLVDTLGEELFSGSSVLSTLPPPVDEDIVVRASEEEDDEEPIPPTLRSSVFVRLHESGEYSEYRPSHRSDSAIHVRVEGEDEEDEEEDNRAA